MPARRAVLNTRVIAIVLLVALPVLIVGAAIVISIGESRLRDAENARLAQIAEYTAGAVDAHVFRQILDAALLARVPEIRRAAVEGSARPYDADRVGEIDRQWQANPAATAAGSGVLATPASEFLADLVANDSVFREVLITDRHGRLVAASNATSDYFQADEDWWVASFDGGRGRVSVTDVRRDASAGVYALEVAVPVQVKAGGDLAGIIKIVADSREVLTGVAGLELGATSEALLVRPNGSIVFRRRPHGEGDRFFAAELLRQRLEDRANRQEAAGPITFEARTDEGVDRFVAVAPSQLGQSYPELSWLVAISVDRAELLAPFRSLVAYLLLVLALTGIAVLAIALWFSLRLAAPAIDPAYDMQLVEHPRIQRIEQEDAER
jgi:hypothetical protein